MFGSADEAVFQEFELEELERPSPRKEVDGRVIHLSRQLNVPQRLAEPVLCDFGSVVAGEQVNTTDVQPTLYRAPEVILQVPWAMKLTFGLSAAWYHEPFGLPRSGSAAELLLTMDLHNGTRLGTCLRVATSSWAEIQNIKPIAAEPTLPVSLGFLGRRRQSWLREAIFAPNSFPWKVCRQIAALVVRDSG